MNPWETDNKILAHIKWMDSEHVQYVVLLICKREGVFKLAYEKSLVLHLD